MHVDQKILKNNNMEKIIKIDFEIEQQIKLKIQIFFV